jgi:hypothetical protein
MSLPKKALIGVFVAFLFAGADAHAQRGRGQAGPPPTPQQGAAVDLTGYWVSVITEDWRVRMVTPPKGYYESVPMNAEARRVADAWDPAKDEAAGSQCKAYGAGAIMRQPGRLHFTWENPTTLKLDIDAGTQTRVFRFDDSAPPAAERTWQGQSTAKWEYASTPRGQPRKGTMVATTTNLRAGYLRKNGVPYSENAVIQEYYDVITSPKGEQWLVLTSEITDPAFLSQPYITSTQFKKQADASGWNPSTCSSR